MAGSDKPKKPGMILHVPSTEARARRRAVQRARQASPRSTRRRPDDFLEVVARIGNYRNVLRNHYSTNEDVVERWAREAGVTLRKLTPEESAKLRKVVVAIATDFDPIRDGDRWRAMHAAMTLKGRAVQGEVWRKEARGEYD